MKTKKNKDKKLSPWYSTHSFYHVFHWLKLLWNFIFDMVWSSLSYFFKWPQIWPLKMNSDFSEMKFYTEHGKLHLYKAVFCQKLLFNIFEDWLCNVFFFKLAVFFKQLSRHLNITFLNLEMQKIQT